MCFTFIYLSFLAWKTELATDCVFAPKNFVAGAVFGEVWGWLCFLCALEMTCHMWRRSLMTFILRGRRTIWWSWRVTLVAPRIGNDVSYVKQITDEIHFVWQAQYLVKLEGDFSWQPQHFVTFWEIAGARNVVIYNTKSSPRSDREGPRSGGCEMTISWSDHGRIILGLSSDYGRIIFVSSFCCTSGSFCWNLELQVFVAGAVFGVVGGWLYLLHKMEMTFHMGCGSRMRFILRGWRSICWVWRVTLLAPRIGNDVSYVKQITDEIHFVRQAQYLVKLEGDFSWQAQHFVTFWGISRSAKCFILEYKMVSKIGPGRSPKRRVRDDDFMVGSWSDYSRIILGLWSDYLRFVFLLHFREFLLKGVVLCSRE